MGRAMYAVLAVLALTACQRPIEITAQARQVAVRVALHGQLPGLTAQQMEDIRASYENQVRARLGQVADTVLNATDHPSTRPLLEISIDEVELSDYPSKSDIFKDWLGDTTEEIVTDAIDQMITRSKEPIEHDGNLSDTLVGRYVVRGIHRHRLEHLGYRPLLISGTLTFFGNGSTYQCDFNGWRLLPKMHPLPKKPGEDQSPQIREEEGRALASFVMERLGSGWRWSVSPD
ncbi:MAG TPA: hypothetical protein VJ486_11975 [Geothrix sp.]|nr:hypothetical protein [Geothrix sp.]